MGGLFASTNAHLEVLQVARRCFNASATTTVVLANNPRLLAALGRCVANPSATAKLETMHGCLVRRIVTPNGTWLAPADGASFLRSLAERGEAVETLDPALYADLPCVAENAA